MTQERFPMLIGGKPVDALSGRTFESQNPFTGAPWAVVPDGGPEDVDAAVAAARAALEGEWGSMTGFARAALLRRLGDLVGENAERLATLEVNDSGKLYREMIGQLKGLGAWYHYYAGLADKIEGRQIPSPNPNYLVYTRREPVGVVAAITPWNSPLLLMTWKLAPALAAGCTIVVKPSEHAPVSTLGFAELIDRAGFPAGVVNVVTGSSRETGAALAAHPGVDKVAFTGSTAVCGVRVSTVDADPRFVAFSRRRLAQYRDVQVACEDSRQFLQDLAGRPEARQETAFFYLDAHGSTDLPLAEELKIITRTWTRAVAMIDDFQVPGDPGYQFDDYGPGKALTTAYLPSMPGWRIYYPAARSTEEWGSRGCAVLAAPAMVDAMHDVTSLVPGDRGELAVTYDNSSSDGVGSQLQRIYGMWALSRAVGVKYVHTPLGRVGYQGLIPLLSGNLEPDFAERLNAFFTLDSDDFDTEHCETVAIHTLNPQVIETHRRRAVATGRSVLLSSCIPFGYPGEAEACSRLREVSPYRHHEPSGPLRVCVHVRRGDVTISGHVDRYERQLPNRYYLRVLATVVEELERQGLPFVVRVHTEVPPRAVTVQPGTPGLYFNLDEPGTTDPAELALEEFDAVPHVEVVANAHARGVLDDFATTDVLVLSKSSLGYVAGLLNPHGLVVSPDWWHPPLPGWLVASRDGDLDRAEVATHITRLGRGRDWTPTAAATVRRVNPELRERGYVACKGLLEPALARVLWTTLLLHQWRGEAFRDNHVPTAASVAGSATTDALLLDLRPKIEEIAGCHLVPTYSYARLYFRGDGLIRHRDRQACEVSVSIHLGRVGGDGSLCFGADDRVDMEEGDGAVYLGCATDHWREPFAGYTMGQVFLHYVDRDGPYADQAFDRRPERFPSSLVTDLTAQ